MTIEEESLRLHFENKGKIATLVKTPLKDNKDLTLAYTPGVAEPCRQINKNPKEVYKYTNIGNTVAVITDGSAVLGLGDIGPSAGLPVMEGKCVLFKEFGNVDAFPIALNSNDPDKIVSTIMAISPSFGGINLEDISAPRCFYIEEKLKKELNIPVFHDDQHGTSIVVLAALINSLKVVDKKKENIKVVINGAGAAGIAITNALINFGVKDITLVDSIGIIFKGRDNLNRYKEDLAKLTNRQKKKGNLADAMEGTDVFIGVSRPNLVSKEMVQSMNHDPIIFAMANPVPEIMPDIAKDAGAAVVGTGRSDFPNQINNVLAFPGVFRGAFDANATEINEEMKLAASMALAKIVKSPNPDMILPPVFDKSVSKSISDAVKDAAIKTGVIRE
ncbi:MAG: malic enzyme-like NAD(P)-binding protein [Candidatus Woesearchaeota archaeon]